MHSGHAFREPVTTRPVGAEEADASAPNPTNPAGGKGKARKRAQRPANPTKEKTVIMCVPNPKSVCVAIAIKLKLPTHAFNALDFNQHFLSLSIAVLSLRTVRIALVGTLSKIGHDEKEI